MNDLLSQASAQSGISEDKASELLESMVSEIRHQCLNNVSVAIAGFGTFSPEKYDETVVTDKLTGKRLLLPPEVTIIFKPSVVLRKNLIR